jgi:hypothetical protein
MGSMETKERQRMGAKLESGKRVQSHVEINNFYTMTVYETALQCIAPARHPPEGTTLLLYCRF